MNICKVNFKSAVNGELETTKMASEASEANKTLNELLAFFLIKCESFYKQVLSFAIKTSF